MLTKEGQLRAKPAPVQPMVLEDLAIDLTQRIDNAVAAQDITPEVGSALKDEVQQVQICPYEV
jgi:hypothetical protein